MLRPQHRLAHGFECLRSIDQQGAAVAGHQRCGGDLSKRFDQFLEVRIVVLLAEAAVDQARCCLGAKRT